MVDFRELVGTVPQPNPQQTPSFTGVGLPTITITPNPQQTIVGYGQIPATIVVQSPPNSFTGFGRVPNLAPTAIPVAIPPQIPTAVPSKLPQGTPYLIPSLQPQVTPNRVPPQLPQATGQSTPQAIPGLTPQPTPQSVPPQSPVAAPKAVPQAKPVMIPRPRPRPNTLKPSATKTPTAHKTVATGPALAKQHITNTPGRQAQQDLPQFDAKGGGQPWRCVASGHGQRKTLTDRRVSVSGTLRHIGSIDVLGRDLPALHPQHAECIISIKRRGD